MYMSEKSEKEDWTFSEKLATFMSTPHEGHAFWVGLAQGISEGNTYCCPPEYVDEQAYNASGFFIGELIDRLSSKTSSTDTSYGLGQLVGVLSKYGAVTGIITALMQLVM